MSEKTRTDRRCLSEPAGWVAAHGDALFRYALLRVRSRGDAEELVQEALLAALQSRESFDGRCEERTWMIGILKHKVMDYFRKQSRERAEELPDDPQVEAMFDKKNHWSPAPKRWDARRLASIDDGVEREEFRVHLQRCMEALPEQLARVFALKVIDETDGQEVCKALKITPTNLWVLLHRARMRLRKCLEMHWLALEQKQGGD